MRIATPMSAVIQARAAAPVRRFLDSSSQAGDIGESDFGLYAPRHIMKPLVFVQYLREFRCAIEVSRREASLIDQFVAEQGIPPMPDSFRTGNSLASDGYAFLEAAQINGHGAANPGHIGVPPHVPGSLTKALHFGGCLIGFVQLGAEKSS